VVKMISQKKKTLNGYYQISFFEIISFLIYVACVCEKGNNFFVSSLCFGVKTEPCSSYARHHQHSSLPNYIFGTSYYETLRGRAVTCKYGTTSDRVSYTSSSLSSSSRTSSGRIFDTNGSTNSTSSKNTIQWDVYICESKQCKERGSAETFGAFVGLAPPNIVAM
jgi:hypothetical protein